MSLDSLIRVRQLNKPDVSGYVEEIISRHLATGTISGIATNTGQLTGAFYPRYQNPSGYITTGQTGVFATQQNLLDTSYSIAASTAALYYPKNNPSGFITGGNIGSDTGAVKITGDQEISGNKIFRTTSWWGVPGNPAYTGITRIDGALGTIIVSDFAKIYYDRAHFGLWSANPLAIDSYGKLFLTDMEFYAGDGPAKFKWTDPSTQSLLRFENLEYYLAGRYGQDAVIDLWGNCPLNYYNPQNDTKPFIRGFHVYANRITSSGYDVLTTNSFGTGGLATYAQLTGVSGYLAARDDSISGYLDNKIDSIAGLDINNVVFTTGVQTVLGKKHFTSGLSSATHIDITGDVKATRKIHIPTLAATPSNYPQYLSSLNIERTWSEMTEGGMPPTERQLAHFAIWDKNRRGQIVLSNLEENTNWAANFLSLMVHGSTYYYSPAGGPYLYDDKMQGKNNSGLALLVAQSTDASASSPLTKLSIGIYNARPLSLFTNDRERLYIDQSGHIGANVLRPTAWLNLRGGDTGIWSAPLKFQSGRLMTVPETGAMEYDGTALYFTNSAGQRSTVGNDLYNVRLTGTQTVSGNKFFKDNTTITNLGVVSPSTQLNYGNLIYHPTDNAGWLDLYDAGRAQSIILRGSDGSFMFNYGTISCDANGDLSVGDGMIPVLRTNNYSGAVAMAQDVVRIYPNRAAEFDKGIKISGFSVLTQNNVSGIQNLVVGGQGVSGSIPLVPTDKIRISLSGGQTIVFDTSPLVLHTTGDQRVSGEKDFGTIGYLKFGGLYPPNESAYLYWGGIDFNGGIVSIGGATEPGRCVGRFSDALHMYPFNSSDAPYIGFQNTAYGNKMGLKSSDNDTEFLLKVYPIDGGASWTELTLGEEVVSEKGFRLNTNYFSVDANGYVTTQWISGLTPTAGSIQMNSRSLIGDWGTSSGRFSLSSGELGTPKFGAIEFDGSSFYLTVLTGTGSPSIPSNLMRFAIPSGVSGSGGGTGTLTDDGTFVRTTGDQTISGEKKFRSSTYGPAFNVRTLGNQNVAAFAADEGVTGATLVMYDYSATPVIVMDSHNGYMTISGVSVLTGVNGTLATKTLGLPTDGTYGGPNGAIAGIQQGDLHEDAFDKVELILGKLAPAKPQNLSAASFILSGTTYSAYMQGTSTLYSNVLNARRFTGYATGFYDGDMGVLSGRINGQLTGLRTLSTSSDVGSFTGLNIQVDRDFWSGVAGRAGFWTYLNASVSPTSNMNSGQFTVQMGHSITGPTAILTGYCEVPGSASATLTNYATGICATRITDGVPSLASNDPINVNFSVAGGVSAFYRNPMAVLAGANVAGANVAPTGTPLSGASLNLSGTVTTSSSTYTTGALLTITAYNSIGATNVTNVPTVVRMDTVSTQPASRKTAGTGQYPTINISAINQPYNNSTSLLANQEMQMINGAIQYPPATNYSAIIPTGPNYSTVQTGTPPSGYRWSLFDAGSITSASNIQVTFNSTSNFGSAVIMTGFLLYAAVSGGTNWLDGNAIYNAGNPYNNGDAALVFASSSATVKRITFGTAVLSGPVYIRVGFASGSNRSFGSISMTQV